jgi:hypothetical protein
LCGLLECRRQPKHGEECWVDKSGDLGNRFRFGAEHHETVGALLQATGIEHVCGHGRLAIGARWHEASPGDCARRRDGREKRSDRPAALVTQPEGWHGEDGVASEQSDKPVEVKSFPGFDVTSDKRLLDPVL